MVRKTRALKSEQREQRRNKQNVRRNNSSSTNIGGYGEFVPTPIENQFKPKSEKQRILASCILAHTLTFATGPAGTGKSHVPIAIGAQLLKQRKIKRIVLTKPDFEIGESIGTVPGDVQEKIANRVRAMRSILIKAFGESYLQSLITSEKVVFEPLGSILGLTYDDAFVIVDEAQVTTPNQMKALLTRTGDRTKVIVCGDYKEQSYIPGRNGLQDALQRLEYEFDVAHVEFSLSDVVRSEFCKTVIKAYRDPNFKDRD